MFGGDSAPLSVRLSQVLFCVSHLFLFVLIRSSSSGALKVSLLCEGPLRGTSSRSLWTPVPPPLRSARLSCVYVALITAVSEGRTSPRFFSDTQTSKTFQIILLIKCISLCVWRWPVRRRGSHTQRNALIVQHKTSDALLSE